MKYTMPCNDEALLFLLHSELPRLAKLRLQLHLWGCPTCRKRAQQYTQLSVGLAATLYRPGQPPRLPRTSAFFLAPLWLIPSLIAVILGSFGAVLLQWKKANPSVPSASAALKNCNIPSKSKEECVN